MAYTWTSIVDAELNAEFRVSPYFGWQLKCKPGEFNRHLASLFGFKDQQYRPTLQVNRDCQVSASVEKFSRNQKNRLPRWNSYVTSHIPLPLALIILKFTASVLYRKLVKRKPSQRHALRFLRRFIGGHDGKNCLPLAATRYALLRCLGIRSKVNVGILVPTSLSHAWIEIDHVAAYEEPDFLALFQKVVEYD